MSGSHSAYHGRVAEDHLSVELRAEIERFCRHHGLVHSLSLARNLVSQFFPLAEEPTVQREQDPETGEEWITLDIVVRVNAEEFADRYDRYTDAFVAAVPWSERDKIRLSYRLA